MKVLVLQADTRTPEEEKFIHYSCLINETYCKKYNYDHKFVQIKKFDRHPSWEKVKVAIDNLSDYDLYFLLDSDCIISNWDLSLEDYLQKSFYIRRDEDAHITFLNNKPFHYTNPCAGVFIYDNKAKELLKDWYNTETVEPQVHPWEQKALEKKLNEYKINIIDDFMFIMYPNQYIRHVCSSESNHRVAIFKTFWDIKNAN